MRDRAPATGRGAREGRGRGSSVMSGSRPPAPEHQHSRLAFDVRGVVKRFDRAKSEGELVLDDVSLEVPRGQITVLLGPSGCGKTTLLNLMAGRISCTSGHIDYDGVPVKGINTRVGYITQHDNLLPWRTAADNIRLSLELKRYPRREWAERVRSALTLVGLEKYADLYPSQLSGGMRKRVSLARTLVHEPKTILMDEPFGALDAQLRGTLQGELLRLLAPDVTVVFVTHDLDEALLLGDRVVVLAAHPGRVLKVRSLDVPRASRTLEAVRGEPEFVDLWRELWADLGTAAGGADE